MCGLMLQDSCSDDGNYPDYNCPCAATPGPDPPAFVGDYYYCESGDTGGVAIF